MIDFEVEDVKYTNPRVSIKVIGVGGAGGNIVNSLAASELVDVELIAANTDAQALQLSKAHHIISLGVKTTKGFGTGANPDLGRRAAQEDIEKIIELVSSADIVFLTGGLGGGTGSGSLPVIAQALKEKNILTIAVVTKPFTFEGKRRAEVANQALEALKKAVDTVIVLPNQKLLDHVDDKISMLEAFSLFNKHLSNALTSIVDIISLPGHINVDFADIRTIMKDKGLAIMGTGRAVGPDRAAKAAIQAISSPLVEAFDINGASGVLINVTAGADLSLHELSVASQIIYEKAHPQAHIIVGSVIQQMPTNEMVVTVIATGFNKESLETVQHAVKEKVHLEELAPQAVQSESGYIHPEKDVQSYAVKHEQITQQLPEEKSLTSVDQEDLDIPSFLRNHIEKSQRVE